MLINTDINILGGLPDFNLINHFLFDSERHSEKEGRQVFTTIKTDKSVKRFEKAIMGTFLQFKSKDLEYLVRSMLSTESISENSLLMLFWNASVNNDLLQYLNSRVYFPAFYSGRLVLKKEEIGACIKELKETDITVQDWTIVTIETVARKYLTLLKKFNLMEGALTKKIIHPYLTDKMFILFIYWITSIETKPNLLESEWIQYCFCERPVFIERLLQKKFSKFFQLAYTGDKLNIETSLPYATIYDAVK
ncbi:BrxA family protein [Mucilaginibacter segetis]|uniref:DUF1819 family protein n=1 Tax=Mucilaginibacter segetis TaxID=2793071 RepID=A0A934PUW9_9SPHI|nr:BrxA family protein [Mucilaginibacter segetis]MBK0380052.1 DUF1819 family protein [Mucilaginibacter segetis]